MGYTEELALKITGDSKEAQDAIAGVVSSFGPMKSVIDHLGKLVPEMLTMPFLSAAAGGAAVASMAVVAGTALFNLTKDVAKSGTELNDLKQSTQIAIAPLSDLRTSTRLAGGSFDVLTTAITNLHRRMGQGKGEVDAALTSLNINVERFKAAKGDEKILLLSDAFRALPPDANRALIAYQLFGTRSGEAISLLMNPMRELMAEAHALGLTLSEEDVAAAQDFKHAAELLDLKLNAVGFNIGRALLPILADLADGLAKNDRLTRGLEVGTGLLIGVINVLVGWVDLQVGALDQVSTRYDKLVQILRTVPGVGDLVTAAMYGVSSSMDTGGAKAQGYHRDITLAATAAQTLTVAERAAIAATEALAESKRALDPAVSSATTRMLAAGLAASDIWKRLKETNAVVDEDRIAFDRLTGAFKDHQAEQKRVAEEQKKIAEEHKRAAEAQRQLEAQQRQLTLSTQQWSTALSAVLRPGLKSVTANLQELSLSTSAWAHDLSQVTHTDVPSAIAVLKQFSSEATLTTHVWGDAWGSMKAKLSQTLSDIPKTLADAFTGGGDLMGAVKSVLTQVGGQIGGSLGYAIGGPLGEKIGSALGAIGGAVLGKLFDSEGKRVNDLRDKWMEAHGGLLAIQQKLVELGNDPQMIAAFNKLYNTGKVKEFEAAVKELESREKSLGAQREILAGEEAEVRELLAQALQRYNFAATERGPILTQQESIENAKTLFKHFTVLTGAHIDQGVVLEHMKDQVNDWFHTALAANVAIDKSMQPMLQHMVDMGLLTDANGEKLTDLSRVQWAETLIDVFKELKADLLTILNRVLGLPEAAEKAAGGMKGVFKDFEIDIPIRFMKGEMGGLESLVGAGTSEIPSFDHRLLERVTSPGLALLHPGDVVGVPPAGLGGIQISVDARGSMFTDRRGMDELANRVAERLAGNFKQRYPVSVI